jgi:hypothetical protein
MGIILSLYAAVLGLAIWQETHGRDDTTDVSKGF